MVIYRTMGSRAALARFLASLLTTPDQRLEEYLGFALQHYKLDLAIPPLAKPEALAGFRRPTLVIGASDDITAPGAALLERARELFPHASAGSAPELQAHPTDRRCLESEALRAHRELPAGGGRVTAQRGWLSQPSVHRTRSRAGALSIFTDQHDRAVSFARPFPQASHSRHI